MKWKYLYPIISLVLIFSIVFRPIPVFAETLNTYPFGIKLETPNASVEGARVKATDIKANASEIIMYKIYIIAKAYDKAEMFYYDVNGAMIGSDCIRPTVDNSYNPGLFYPTDGTFEISLKLTSDDRTGTRSVWFNEVETSSTTMHYAGIPSIPNQLVDAGDGSITWQANNQYEAVLSYSIYANDNKVADVTGTSFNYNTLPAGTYYIVIQANNIVGYSGLSEGIVVTSTGGHVPPVPSTPGKPVSDSSSGTISWPANPSGDNVTGYSIHVDGTNVATVTDTSFNYHTLPAGTHSVTVAANNAHGTSAQSSSVTVTSNGSGSSAGGTAFGDVVDSVNTVGGQLTNIINQQGTLASDINNIGNQLDQILNVVAKENKQDQTNSILGNIKSSIENLSSYITTPRSASSLNTNLGPVPTFDPTVNISEPNTQPYIYDVPAPQMPTYIDSPGPLPSIPDPSTFIMPHDDPNPSDSPISITPPLTPQTPTTSQNPLTPQTPLTSSSVTMDDPLTRSPVSMDNPLTLTIVQQSTPITPQTPIEPNQPYARHEPITPQ